MAGKRHAQLVSLPFGPGVLSNTTPRSAKVRVNYVTWDRWRDCSWVRWHKTLPEKIPGWQYLSLTDVNGNADAQYQGLARGLVDWASLDGQYWISIGTHQHLYLENNGTLYDITPIRYNSNVSNAFSTTESSAVVTVVDPNNGAQNGDFVQISGGSEIGDSGITLSGTYQITWVSLDSYTVTAATAATSTVSGGGGSASLAYQITPGLPSNGQLYGYGTYLYGEFEYGTPRPTGDGVYARLQSWSLMNYGQDLIASPSDGSIYWWQRGNGPTAPAALLDATAPTGCQRVLVDGAQRVIIALGCTGLDSLYDPLLVRWCDLDDITTWIPSLTNIAGDYPLTIGSRIVTGLWSKGQNLIWTDKHLYRMVLTGGTAVYSFYGCGDCHIVGPNAAADVNGVGYFMGFDNFYTYSGTLQVLDSEVWETVFDPNQPTSIDRTQTEKVYCFTYEPKSEITWLYPSISSAGDVDRYVTYNWDDEVWYFGAWNRTACQGQSPAVGTGAGSPYGVNDGWLYQQEVGTDAVEQSGTVAIPWYMTSLDITTGGAHSEFTMGGSDMRFAIGASDSHLRGLSVIPDFMTFSGEMQLTVSTKDRPQDSTYIVNGPAQFDVDTQQIDIDWHGSQIQLRFDNLTDEGDASLGSAFRMGVLQALAIPYAHR